jgi:hypothetical protein
MDLYKILNNLLENPLVPRFYRELHEYYTNNGKLNEAAAFTYLIEQKFDKNDQFNSTSDNKK